MAACKELADLIVLDCDGIGLMSETIQAIFIINRSNKYDLLQEAIYVLCNLITSCDPEACFN